MAATLAPERLGQALAAIALWRTNAEPAVTCPMCGARAMKITDQSARPYAEWYALNCDACGLDATINVPMAPPDMS